VLPDLLARIGSFLRRYSSGGTIRFKERRHALFGKRFHVVHRRRGRRRLFGIVGIFLSCLIFRD
jgi:hypothetical protein